MNSKLNVRKFRTFDLDAVEATIDPAISARLMSRLKNAVLPQRIEKRAKSLLVESDRFGGFLIQRIRVAIRISSTTITFSVNGASV